VRAEWEAKSRDAGYDPNGLPITGNTPQTVNHDAPTTPTIRAAE